MEDFLLSSKITVNIVFVSGTFECEARWRIFLGPVKFNIVFVSDTFEGEAQWRIFLDSSKIKHRLCFRYFEGEARWRIFLGPIKLNIVFVSGTFEGEARWRRSTRSTCVHFSPSSGQRRTRRTPRRSPH